MRGLVAALVAAVLLAGCGVGEPAGGAAGVVPADALVYLHVSTDPDRDPDARLLEKVRGFPAAGRLLERLPEQLDLARDVRPWLGDEAAVALLDTGTPRADVLMVAAVRDRPKAEGFLTRIAGARPGIRHRGVVIRRFSNLAAAFAGDFLVAGQEAAVRRAIDTAQGERDALSGLRSFERLADRAPEERSAYGWASPAGVRRVLGPLPGIGGALGALLDHRELQGVSAAVVAEDEGLRMHVRAERPGRRAFEPELVRTVARDAAAYFGLAGADAFAPLLGQLAAGAGLELDPGLLRALDGEVAVSVTPRLPVPIVTLVARTGDERRAREALARMQQPLAQALSGSQGVVTFEQRDVLGHEAFALRVATGFELIYAVWDGRVAISTAQPGLEQAIEPDGDLTEAGRFEATIGEVPDEVEALAFVHLSELLALAEQTGLTGNPGFDGVRDDLRRVRAAGAIVRREEPDTTAELFFEIP